MLLHIKHRSEKTVGISFEVKGLFGNCVERGRGRRSSATCENEGTWAERENEKPSNVHQPSKTDIPLPLLHSALLLSDPSLRDHRHSLPAAREEKEPRLAPKEGKLEKMTSSTKSQAVEAAPFVFTPVKQVKGGARKDM